MKYTFFILIISILTISCTRNANTKNGQSNIELIKVDFSKEYTQKKFPNTNYSMRVQRLEDNKDFPVGYVDKLIVNDERIYLLDRSKSQSIFVYNRAGTLLQVINRIGNGPGEFTSPTDFDVDKKTDNLLVMDANLRKILIYSPKGNFIREFKYDSFAIRLLLDNEGNIILDNGNIPSPEGAYYLSRIDQNGKHLNSFFPADSSVLGITLNSREPLQRTENELFFLPVLSNRIYSLQDDEPSLVYQIDFGKYWPDNNFCEQMKKVHPLKIRQFMFENNYVCFLNYIQTKDVLHIDFYKDKNYSLYYNKQTKQSLLVAMEDESMSFPLATYGNEFVFIKYNEITGAPTVVFYTVNFDLL